MRILLDECLPKALTREFPDHNVKTVPQAGWAGISNGTLLQLVADSGKYDIFITVDRRLPREHQTATLPFAIVVLHVKSNRIADILPLAPEIARRLSQFRPGHVYIIG